jgi:hypothetical protein|tara:strand:- start:214 stop:480 length:267 start_codon:yes stop_codon:yes gene_type:complete
MEIKIGQKVFLKHDQSACNRTKNRIREHGSKGFVIEMFVPASSHFGGAPAICFRSVSELSSDGIGGKERWRGWFPIGEIIMTEETRNA